MPEEVPVADLPVSMGKSPPVPAASAQNLPEAETSPSEQLASAIRRIIREEIHNGGGAAEPAPLPEGIKRRETVGLLLLIVNVVLLYMLLSEEVRKKDLVDFITKVVPFLGGGLALANPKVFRRTLSSLCSRPRFIQLNVALMLVLGVSRLGRFPIKPAMEPAEASYSVDGDGGHMAGTSVWLDLGNHPIEISPPKAGYVVGPKKTPVEPRKFELSWGELLWYSLPLVEQPRWPLLSRVTLLFEDEERYLVRVSSKKHEFDRAFRRSTVEYAALAFEDRRTARYEFLRPMTYFPIKLPFGEYAIEVSLRRSDGKVCRLEQPFAVNESQNELPFGPLECPP